MSHDEFDVFISYSRSERDLVDSIVAELSLRGITYWIDRRNIEPGSDWIKDILAHIEICRHFIVFISEQSLTSTYVRGEIERAHALQKIIFPVRLDDAQISDPIAFYIQSRQFTTIKSAHDQAAIEQLCRRIKDPVTHYRHQASTGARKRLVSLSALAALLIGVPFGMWWSGQQGGEAVFETEAARYEAETKRQAIQDAENRRKLIDKLDVTPIFNSRGGNISLSSIQKSHEIGGLQYLVASGDGKHRAMSYGVDIPEAGYSKFSIIAMDGDAVAKTFDKTVDLHAFLRQHLIHQGVNPDSSGCDGFLCYMQYYEGCHPFIRRIEFSMGDLRFDLDRSACRVDPAQRKKHEICQSGLQVGKPFPPGTPLTVRKFLANGEVLEQVSVVALSHNKGETFVLKAEPSNWTILDGSPVSGKGFAPKLAIRYEPPSAVVGQYQLVLLLDRCATGPARVSLLVDADGAGFVELRNNGPGFNASTYFSPGDKQDAEHALPSVKRDILLKVAENGKTIFGPYRYHFDPAEVIRRTALPNFAPDTICQRTGIGVARVCFGRERLAWFDVKEVKFGPGKDTLSKSVQVDFTVDDYIKSECALHKQSCPPFFFNVPAGWQDVYSQVIMTSGEELEVKRHTSR